MPFDAEALGYEGVGVKACAIGLPSSWPSAVIQSYVSCSHRPCPFLGVVEFLVICCSSLILAVMLAVAGDGAQRCIVSHRCRHPDAAQVRICQSDEQVVLERCAKTRCVLGCKLCQWNNGRFNYSLHGCVNACLITSADTVDQGPHMCSYLVNPDALHRPHTASTLGDGNDY